MEFVKPELRLHTSYKVIDVRREKKYGKECHVQIYAPVIPSLHAFDEDPWRRFRDALARIAPAAVLATYYRDMYTVGWYTIHKASKPSAICPDEVARKDLPSDEELLLLVQNAYVDAYRAYHHAVTEQKLHRTTADLLTWYRDAVSKKAKKVMCWEQKLTALQAEFQAEVTIQAAAMLDEAKTTCENEPALKNDIVKYAGVKLFGELAVWFINEYRPQGIPSFFHGADATAVASWVAKQIDEQEKKDA